MRGRLFASAATFALAAIAAALRDYGSLHQQFFAQLELAYPLLVALGVINALVVVNINPWRHDGVPERFPTIIQDAITIALFALATFVVLQERVFTATAVGAVVIGFALQETLGNLFAGLAIQVEKPFRVGHWVSVGGKEGIVTETTWRATKVRTKTGNLIVLPNSVVARDIVVNYSQPKNDTRLDIDVGVSYDAAPSDVKAAVLEALAHVPGIARPDMTDVLVQDFAAYSVVYRIRVWIRDFAELEDMYDRVRTVVFYAFRRRGINIPFPIQTQIWKRWTPAAEADRTRVVQALENVEIFSLLSEEQCAALGAAARPVVYGCGEVIVRQGDVGSSMFIVVSGEAIVTLEPSNREVARLAAGAFFGEMSLLTGESRTATVTAACDCEVLEITADAFRTFVLENPAALDQVSAAAAKRTALLAHLKNASGADGTAEPASTMLAAVRRFLGLAGS